MNKHALFHQPKSEYAYAYDEKRIHILFRTAKNDIDQVYINFGDPFDWTYHNGKAQWNHEMKEMVKRYQTNDFDYYFVEIEPKDYRMKYAFVLVKQNVTYFYGSKRLHEVYQVQKNEFKEGNFYDLSNYFNFPYLNKEDLPQTPEWVKNTIWYQIFPDRFYSKNKKSDLTWGNLPVKNNELYGGDIEGVKEKLPYLKDLGITGIYFTPIFLSPSAHKYDTTDYYQIDPQFGTNETFKEFVKAAHEQDIKVVLDAVFNHCGWFHPWWQDVVKNGRKSKYADCFFLDKDPIINFDIDQNGLPIVTRDLRPNYRTFAYTPFMPKWNTDNPLVQEHLLGVVKYWIEEYDIDGWRLDVSNEISHDFLRKIKETSRKANPNTFIFGENWDSSLPWLRGDQMDSVMNYDLTIPIWQYFERKIDASEFQSEIQKYLALTPKNVMENMFNLLDTHDTVRMLRRLDDNVNRLKIAYTIMFLSAGAPNIYYGSEIGLTGDHDPDNRRCFIWDEKEWNHELRNYIKRLIELRRNHETFADYDYHFMDPNNISFYKRKNDELILVLLNDEPHDYKLKINPLATGEYLDLVKERTISIHEEITLYPYEILLLKKLY